MTTKGKKTRAVPTLLSERLDQIDQRLISIYQKLHSIDVRIADNGDTSPEQVQEYLNKIGRMIASEKFEGTLDFLQGVFRRVESTQHITRKQMAAVDRIAARGCVDEFTDDGDWRDER